MIDKEKYALVHTYKGVGIYTLKVFNPAKGDELGYRTDSEYVPGVYDTLGDTAEAIDTYLVRKKLR